MSRSQLCKKSALPAVACRNRIGRPTAGQAGQRPCSAGNVGREGTAWRDTKTSVGAWETAGPAAEAGDQKNALRRWGRYLRRARNRRASPSVHGLILVFRKRKASRFLPNSSDRLSGPWLSEALCHEQCRTCQRINRTSYNAGSTQPTSRQRETQ